MNKRTQEIIDYYHSKESLLGYKLLLRGTKHFGYYPADNKHISMKIAMNNMIDNLAGTLNLSGGCVVLDAGCGEGTTAIRLAEKYNLKVEGIDLIDFNIKNANKRISNSSVQKSVNFSVGDYTKLPFPDNHFDGVYTMETLVHAPDYKSALLEFRRVLKPGGKLVLFEYSMPAQEDMGNEEKHMFAVMNEGSAMHSLPEFIHDTFSEKLKVIDYENIKVKNITGHVLPMFKRLYQIAIVPYQVIKIFGKEKKFVNATAAVTLWRYRNDFRYNIITASKPR